MRTIIIHGASTAAGWYDMEQAGWGNRLMLDVLSTNRLNPQEAILVKNDSVPGTTLPAVRRGMVSQIERFQTMGSVTTIMALGLNESKIRKDETVPVVPIEDFRAQLEMYADELEARRIKTVYLGTELLLSGVIVTDNGNIFNDSLTAEYDHTLKEHAQKRGMPYIDTRRLLQPSLSNNPVCQDGIHPNEAGHSIIHSAIKDTLKNLGDLLPHARPEGLYPENV